MTNEEAIEWLKDEYEHARCDECIEGEYVNALELAIKVLESQPCEDAVSREAVLGLAKKGILVSNDNYKCVVNAIKSLPPVTPQRPKGKWIDVNGDQSLFECSKCGDKVCCANNNYCPNCGSYNGGGEDAT